jgi:hypothetical protein
MVANSNKKGVANALAVPDKSSLETAIARTIPRRG